MGRKEEDNFVTLTTKYMSLCPSIQMFGMESYVMSQQTLCISTQSLVVIRDELHKSLGPV